MIVVVVRYDGYGGTDDDGYGGTDDDDTCDMI